MESPRSEKVMWSCVVLWCLGRVLYVRCDVFGTGERLVISGSLIQLLVVMLCAYRSAELLDLVLPYGVNSFIVIDITKN